MPGNFALTLRRTAAFSVGVPFCETRDSALRAWFLSSTGYLRPGNAKSPDGNAFRVLVVSFAIFHSMPVMPTATQATFVTLNGFAQLRGQPISFGLGLALTGVPHLAETTAAGPVGMTSDSRPKPLIASLHSLHYISP